MIIESDIKSLKEEKVNLKDETVESPMYIYQNYICVPCLLDQKGVVKLGH